MNIRYTRDIYKRYIFCMKNAEKVVNKLGKKLQSITF